MSEPLVRVQVQGPAGVITLNRPDKRNALNRLLLDELAQAFSDLHQQRSARALILTGAGPAFCAGMDLAEMLQTSEQDDAYLLWEHDARVYRDLLETMFRFPKPLIAAVNGPAVGGGGGLMLGCDVVVASEEAHFALPEPLRGLVAAVVAPMLTFRIGCGQAARLLVTSADVDAAEARRIGLFHEVVPAEGVMPRALELAADCAAGAPEALQMTRRMLNETIGEHIPTLLTAGAAMSATARTTEAAAEGLTAFKEKREPEWQ